MSNTGKPFVNGDIVNPILNQARVEQDMLANAKDGLSTALEWQTEGETFTRKLSSLRFAAQNYQSHLERSMAIEEHDGYMDYILEESPQYSKRITSLRKEHDEFRATMSEIMTKLERLAPTDHVGLQVIRQDVHALLRNYEAHNRREASLIQEAVLTDCGAAD